MKIEYHNAFSRDRDRDLNKMNSSLEITTLVFRD